MPPPGRRTNLLDAITPLIGRADALAELEERFARGRRLVTLVGPPGVGKTRVALAFAAELSPSHYPGGIWHADLRDCRSEDEIRARVQSALSGPNSSTPADASIDEVLRRAGNMFLLLDDVEPALPALAPLLENWLRSAPGLSCLVTSRERVGLRAEASLVLEPLSQDAAIALFEERSELARGARVVADPLVLHAIVRRLECMPLAIEIAAEHTRALDPSELLARLEPTLPFLSSSDRTGLPRTRCLRAALDASLETLTPHERSAWFAFSQFEGEFDLHDAEAVFDPPHAPTAVVLTRLSERSLLHHRTLAGASLYRVYRTAREYAAEQLANEPAANPLQQRFTEFIASQARAYLDGDADIEALTWLSRHHQTLQTLARPMLTRGAVEGALELLVAASHAATFQGPVEPTLALLENVRLDSTVNQPLRCRALRARGRLRARAGDSARALHDFEAARAALDATETPDFRVSLAIDLGNLHRHGGDWQRARAYYDDALAICAAADLESARVRVLACVAGMAHERGDLAGARDTFERALHSARTLELPLAEATILQNLGPVLQELGNRHDAAACFRQAIESHRRLGHRRFEGIAEYDLASLALEEDSLGEARTGFERAVQLASEVGDRREFGLSLALLAVCHALAHELELASLEMTTAERVLRSLGQPSLLLALELHRAHLDLAASLRDWEAGNPDARAQKLATVRDTLARASSQFHDSDAQDHALRPSGDEARYAARILQRAYQRHLALTHAALVDRDGRWFQPPGADRVHLTNRPPLQRLLRALIQRRIDAPNHPVAVADLIRAGWPDEKGVTKAAKNRLHVAITTLRKSGLDPHLIHTAGGYQLTNVMPWTGTSA